MLVRGKKVTIRILAQMADVIEGQPLLEPQGLLGHNSPQEHCCEAARRDPGCHRHSRDLA